MFVFFFYSHSPGTRLAEVTRYCQGRLSFLYALIGLPGGNAIRRILK